jgi:adenylate cyclase
MGGKILQKVQGLFEETQDFVLGNALLVQDLAAISPKNDWLHFYMLNLIRYHPDIPYFFIGAVNGNYLEVGNLATSAQQHYLSDTSKPLPKEAVYEWQYYSRDQGSLKTENYYYDKDTKLLSSEILVDYKYDPRERPWYKQAVETGQFRWSDIYRFYDTGDPGITASLPLYDTQKKRIGVLGADLSFRFLSQFFSDQVIGKTGKPFIVDAQSGHLVIPDETLFKSSPIPRNAIADAFRLYQAHKGQDFALESEEILYLVNIEPFEVQKNLNWLIMVIVPYNDFLGDLVKTQLQTLLIVVFICFISSLVIAYFAQTLSSPIVALSKEVDRIQRLDLKSDERVPSMIKEIGMMDSSVYAMKLAFRSFIHYVPREIVRQLLAQHKEIALGGEKKEVTILFSDIADFTSISETQPTEALMSLLTEYFDGLSKIILQHQGTIDKYIGDSVMAFWGAPLDVPHHPSVCAEAVLLCAAFVHELNERRKKENKPLFYTRFGIHTGSAIVGNIGTQERMNYTLIGDAVNSTSRLQGINKIYHTHIIISEQVAQQLGDFFLVRPIDIVEVKGKKQKITIYEFVGKKDGPASIRPTEKDLALCASFENAYKSFYANDLQGAKKLFEAIQKEFPDDMPTEIYLKRLTI